MEPTAKFRVESPVRFRETLPQREIGDGSSTMSWDRPFAQPVPLPKGPPARTLRHAADYIRTLPPPERERQEWRLAIQMLIDAAEDRGPMLFARMGIVRALETDIE
jgi:hypothetical protein